MARPTEAYADTSAFIAFLDRSDRHHPLFRRLFSSPPPLLTTSLVVSEGHAWFLRRFDARRAQAFLAAIDALPSLEIVAVGAPELRAAAEVARRLSDQSLTLVDALGLHIMMDRRIGHCWSTDVHLGLTGVPLVIHQVG